MGLGNSSNYRPSKRPETFKAVGVFVYDGLTGAPMESNRSVPQHDTMPLTDTPQVKSYPLRTEKNLSGADKRVGEGLLSHMPCPSCPRSPAPQQRTSPTVVVRQLWRAPAEIEALPSLIFAHDLYYLVGAALRFPGESEVEQGEIVKMISDGLGRLDKWDRQRHLIEGVFLAGEVTNPSNRADGGDGE